MNYPPPPPPLPPGGPPPGRRGAGLETTGWAMLGAFLFITATAICGFVVFIAIANSSDTSMRVVVAIAAAFGVLAAFGGGTLLILRRTPVTKGLGMGFMIGWALVTICTAGFCTGVNPSIYGAEQILMSPGVLR